MGPIPAHAGQPQRGRLRRRPGGAYPRSRGATIISSTLPAAQEGLSPLTRGNQHRAAAGCDRCGPIPAHAGQPWRAGESARRTGAYPRSRGATQTAGCTTARPRGLSPLTRGNLLATFSGGSSWGPIPAHAGQPGPSCERRCACRAYPRSRGATSNILLVCPSTQGLSPLTRGNLAHELGQHEAQGPIPAHAGQPSSATTSARSTRAYPRSRGATVTVPANASSV